MGQASIPLDPHNPGHVLACMGFMEISDVLLDDVEGQFDWDRKPNVFFTLTCRGNWNPVKEVLNYLATATLQIDLNEEGVAPSNEIDEKTRPCILMAGEPPKQVSVSHWADSSSRITFKQFAGGGQKGDAILAMCLESSRSSGLMDQDPFNLVLPLQKSTFKFDARAAWTSRDAGYSLDLQNHKVLVSPLVEILAAVGLEHARPFSNPKNRRVHRYGIWGVALPPALARAVIGGANPCIPHQKLRTFVFRQNRSSQGYKQCTFSTEETQP